MARKYKRKSNGQFAGGGGGSAGRSAKGKKGSKAKPVQGPEAKAKAKLAAKKKRSARKRKVLMFAAENPQIVVGLVGGTAAFAVNRKMALNNATASRKIRNSREFKRDMMAAARGLGATVGSQGLKAKKQNRKGVYKL